MCWLSGLRLLADSSNKPKLMKKITFSREMGFKESEFLRIFPVAVNGANYQAQDDRIVVQMEPGELVVEIGAQQYRKIASISLPYLKILFSFDGVSQQRVDEFLKYFDLRYQRGGG